VVALDGNVLLDLDIIYALENGEAMSNTGHPHLLQIVMLQCYQCLANNFIFCSSQCQLELSLEAREVIPRNWSPYCRNPKVLTKSAHSSAVHSVIIVSGSRSPEL
jgi:hypothetical protein